MAPQGAASTTIIFGQQVSFSTDESLNEAGVLWPVTHQLCDLILREEGGSLRGRSLVELGSGTGALSAAAAKAGACAVATDLPCVVPLCSETIARNGPYFLPGSARAAVHAWGQPPEGLGAPFDVVVACECAYWGGWDLLSEDTRNPLVNSLAALTGCGSRMYFGFTVREAIRERELLRMIGKRFRLQYHLPVRGGGGGGEQGAGGGNGAAGLPDSLQEGEVVLAVGALLAQ